MVEVRQQIRRLRQQKGMTTVELGELVGVTGASISRIEGGKQNITLQVLARIALALNVRMADLIDERESGVYAYVRGRMRGGSGILSALDPEIQKGRDEPIPLPLKPLPGAVYEAFETDTGFLIGLEKSFPDDGDLKQPFLVLSHYSKNTLTLEWRKFETSQAGFGFTAEGGDPARRWMRADDKRIRKLWRIVAEIHYYGPKPY